jgi:hypothetical protein
MPLEDAAYNLFNVIDFKESGSGTSRSDGTGPAFDFGGAGKARLTDEQCSR